MSQPRCPSCSGPNLSPPTFFKTQSSNRSNELLYQGAESSWVDTGKKAYAVDRGRACLDCGYVSVFLGATALASLRAELATLKALEGDG